MFGIYDLNTKNNSEGKYFYIFMLSMSIDTKIYIFIYNKVDDEKQLIQNLKFHVINRQLNTFTLQSYVTPQSMMLQFKTKHCDGILLRELDISRQFLNWQVCTYICVCKCLLFQFFCLKGCLLCTLQFLTPHLNIKCGAYCFGL